eukprot:2366898-Prymnesium_polylepis.1
MAPATTIRLAKAFSTIVSGWTHGVLIRVVSDQYNDDMSRCMIGASSQYLSSEPEMFDAWLPSSGGQTCGKDDEKRSQLRRAQETRGNDGTPCRAWGQGAWGDEQRICANCEMDHGAPRAARATQKRTDERMTHDVPAGRPKISSPFLLNGETPIAHHRDPT